MCSMDEIFPLLSPSRSHYFNGVFWIKILCPKCRKANHSLSTSLCIHAYLNKVTGIHFSTVCLLISSGDWKYGMRFGEGVLTYTNGAGYRGQWELDKVSALKERNLRASSPGRPRKKGLTLSVFVIDSVKRRLSYRYPWYLIWCRRRPVTTGSWLD